MKDFTSSFSLLKPAHHDDSAPDEVINTALFSRQCVCKSSPFYCSRIRTVCGDISVKLIKPVAAPSLLTSMELQAQEQFISLSGQARTRTLSQPEKLLELIQRI